MNKETKTLFDKTITIDRRRDKNLSVFSKATLDDRYLLEEESYQDLFARVACAYADDEAHAQRLYDYISNLWFMPATPVLSNGGAGRALPISCYLNSCRDSLGGIVELWNENVWLASNGGGVGSYWGNLRSIGEDVKKAGKTSGIIPFIKVMDSQTLAISQGSLRRGSAAVYLDIWHPEIEEFVEIRKPTGGDANRRSLNLHHGVMVDDAFMEAVEKGTSYNLRSPKTNEVIKTIDARALWSKILTMRIETGEPYVVFSDTVNNAMPEHHKKSGLRVQSSNLCFTGDTVVAIADGRNGVTIAELAKESNGVVKFPVYSASHRGKTTRGKSNGGTLTSSAWKTEIKNAIAFKTGEKKTIKVTLSNGDSFKCTPEHEIATTDGAWVKAMDSIGLEIEPFFTNTDSNGAPYRCIKSVSYNKQSNMIWDFYNPNDKRLPGENIDHIVGRGCYGPEYDSIHNLQKLSAKNHRNKTSEEFMGEGNPIHSVDKEYLRGYVSNATKGERNPTYSGISNHKLIELGKNILETHQKFNRSMYFSELVERHGAPKTFSKYRFGGGAEGFRRYVSYVLGEMDYNGEYEPDYDNFSLREKDETRHDYIETYFYNREDNNLSMKGLVVVDIEEGEIEEVFDLTVEDNHNFYIITSTEDDNYLNCQGILVHNCAEIMLPTGVDHHGKDRTAVCCLSSLNIEFYEEWSIHEGFMDDVLRFLDNVLQDFIDRAPDTMAKARYAAAMERSIGLGVMGFHSFLQAKGIPFEGVMAKVWNNRIFSFIKENCDRVNEELAHEKGPCPDAAEYDIMKRFSNCTAIAPTASISIIANQSSPGIEPFKANTFTHKTLTGSHFIKNRHLEETLKKYRKNTDEVWSSIVAHDGSVQHLDFLTDTERDVFKTAIELDQRWVVEHAADRTPFIDQSQSVNLFFEPAVHKKELHGVHFKAWKSGVKSLYYCRSEAKHRASKIGSDVERVRLDEDVPSLNILPIAVPEEPETQYDECLACQ